MPLVPYSGETDFGMQWYVALAGGLGSCCVPTTVVSGRSVGIVMLKTGWISMQFFASPVCRTGCSKSKSGTPVTTTCTGEERLANCADGGDPKNAVSKVFRACTIWSRAIEEQTPWH